MPQSEPYQRALALVAARIAFVVFVPLFSIARPAAAQILTGRVVEAVTEAPIPGAALHVVDRANHVVATALAGAGGDFVLPLPPASDYTVRVEHIGYSTTSFETATPAEVVTVRMTSEVIALHPIEVSVSRVAKLERVGFYERRDLGLGTFIDRRTIEATPARTAGDVLRRVTGLRLMPQGSFTEVASRGTQNCRPGIYLDGALVSGARRVATSFNLEDLPAPALEAVEVYPSSAAVPMQFSGGHSLCGIILFWTRRPGA